MNLRNAVSVIILIVLAAGCQGSASETPTVTPPPDISVKLTRASPLTTTPSPTLALHSTPTITGVISQGKLPCVPIEVFSKCIDDILNIEFEYPTVWGEIEAVLRTGGYTGYAYFYYFDGKPPGETEPLTAGGRSRDFSEGRGGMPTDFAGYGYVGIQREESCEPRDMYPICEQINPGVTWMLRFPNAKFYCGGGWSFILYPVVRIEVDLPENSRINGFVFEAPFLSKRLSNQTESDLFPLLGMGTDMMATKCGESDQLAYDTLLLELIEKINTKSVDAETAKHLDDLVHLAESIVFR